MGNITASMVKELREKTGAGMMDCKKALSEVSGDIEAAVDWLRKSGLASAAKKAGRVAAEGLVGVKTQGRKGALVEVNAETDFVGRNPQFQEFVSQVSQIVAGTGESLETVKQSLLEANNSVQDSLTNLVATIGENMDLRRVAFLEVASGVVSGYVHNSVAAGLGKIGVIVALESDGDKERLDGLGRQLAMHVAAAAPQWTCVDEVDKSALDRERTVLAEQARQSGKPEEIIEKMVEGRMRKYFEEVVLEEQLFVIDGETKVRAVIEAAARELGAPIKLAGFRRFVLGEGIEREEADFAAEVAAAAKG